LLVGACLLGPPAWAIAVTYAIRWRARRRAIERAATPSPDYRI